jgi:hypothetical protein
MHRTAKKGPYRTSGTGLMEQRTLQENAQLALLWIAWYRRCTRAWL